MSVVLRCVKCNGVLEERTTEYGKKIWCARCNDFLGSKPEPTDHESQVISLLTEIRDHLAKLTE